MDVVKMRSEVRVGLDELPPTLAAWRGLLKRVPPEVVRAACVERLRAPVPVTPIQARTLGFVLAQAGLAGAEPTLRALVEVTIDRELADANRLTAFDTLESLTEPLQLLKLIGPHIEVMSDLMALRLGMALASASDPGRFVLETLASIPPGLMREPLMRLFDRKRKEAGLGCVQVFGPILQAGTLTGEPAALWVALTAAVASREPAVGPLLQSLRDGTQDPKLRGSYQRALLEAGTAAIAPTPPKTPETDGCSAFLGPSDGTGVILILASIPAEGGRYSFVKLVVSLTRDVREGFVRTDMTGAEVDEVLMHTQLTLPLAPASMALVADLAKSAADRTRALNLPLPVDSEPALRLLSRFHTGKVTPVVVARPRVVAADFEKLFDGPEYNSWIFRPGDIATLRSWGMPNDSMVVTPERLKVLIRYVDVGPIPLRLHSMIVYQSVWHQLRGEDGLSSVAAACGRQFERGLRHSAVAMYMLRAGLIDLASCDPKPPEPTATALRGDPEARDLVRTLLIALGHLDGARAPTARDLMVLDLTVALWVALENICLGMLSDQVPRDELRVRTLAPVALLVAQRMATAGDPSRVDRDLLDADLGSARPDLRRIWPRDVRWVESVLIKLRKALHLAVYEICAGCPLACAREPSRPRLAELKADVHPRDAAPVSALASKPASKPAGKPASKPAGKGKRRS